MNIPEREATQHILFEVVTCYAWTRRYPSSRYDIRIGQASPYKPLAGTACKCNFIYRLYNSIAGTVYKLNVISPITH